MKKPYKPAKLALIAAAVAMFAAAPFAQSQDKLPESAAQQLNKPGDLDVSVVTIFPPLPRGSQEIIRGLDSRMASSCAFIGADNSHDDEFMDAYFTQFYGRNYGSGLYSHRGFGSHGSDYRTPFSDTSPYGDASHRGSFSSRFGHCSQSDRNFAAGKNYILRKDKSLTLAYAAYDAGELSKALQAFENAYSKIGWDDAALMLGQMHLYGQGTPRDVKKAMHWYAKVANARYTRSQSVIFSPLEPDRASSRVQAQLRLARIHMIGFDVPKDPVKARYWYKEAVDLDHVPSYYVLASMLQVGYGGDKDLKGAAKLFAKAAEQGYAPAQFTLGSMYQNGEGLVQDKALAFKWFQEAAFNAKPDHKKPFAQFELARMYDSGDGVKANPERALMLYKLAAVAGHPEAQNALATYFYTGQIVQQDMKLARKLFISSASQGHSQAMMNAAAMLMNSEGGTQDMTQGYVWLRLAAKLGHEQAHNMAKIYEEQLSSTQKAAAEAILAPKAAKIN